MHTLKVEISKFTLVGAINFVFTFILFYLLVRMIQINYLISLIVVSLLGMILTYTLNYLWVFKTSQKLSFNRCLIKYILAGFLSISMNALVLDCVVSQTNFDPFYVQLALIPFIVIINFATAKYWSLRANGEE